MIFKKHCICTVYHQSYIPLLCFVAVLYRYSWWYVSGTGANMWRAQWNGKMYTMYNVSHETYTRFVDFCFVGVIQSELCQWSDPERYGTISLYATITTHKTSWTMGWMYSMKKTLNADVQRTVKRHSTTLDSYVVLQCYFMGYYYPTYAYKSYHIYVCLENCKWDDSLYCTRLTK